MRTSGFTAERAIAHDVAEAQILPVLLSRGYLVEILRPEGDGPDLFVETTGEYLEIKTGYRPDTGRVAIKVGCLDHARSARRTTLFVFPDAPGFPVHTYETLSRRAVSGPRRPSGNGSNTDFVLFNLKPWAREETTSFESYFPPLA